jgi:hypothetical protein
MAFAGAAAQLSDEPEVVRDYPLQLITPTHANATTDPTSPSEAWLLRECGLGTHQQGTA